MFKIKVVERMKRLEKKKLQKELLDTLVAETERGLWQLDNRSGTEICEFLHGVYK